MFVHGKSFDEIVAVDFEFRGQPGDLPQPVCLVAAELVSGRRHRIWLEDGGWPKAPPYSTDDRTLFMAFYASAEVACHLVLGWPVPARVLDLFAEFRVLTNGLKLQLGSGLVGALTYFGLGSMSISAKEEIREKILRGGVRTAADRQEIIDYCATDVDALQRLLPVMAPQIDLRYAEVRGRYMAAAAAMEHRGIPVDRAAFLELRDGWETVQESLVRRVDPHGLVFEGASFKSKLFGNWLASQGIYWPRLDSGALALDDDTFKDMALRVPAVAPIRELRQSLAQLRPSKLAVGQDGRNRALLSAFQARTGRNQPKSSQFIFGQPKWMRSLIRPEEGTALVYSDYRAQEFAIAAAYSGDANMIAAYESADPYMTFAIQAGAAPAGATKKTHERTRAAFKQVALGVQYGQGVDGLARRLGVSPAHARELLAHHRRTFPTFWQWSDAAVDYATLRGSLHTVFGWRTLDTTNPRSLRNFPMQGAGSEMLRVACCLCIDRGVRLAAPVHDAILFESPIDDVDHTVAIAEGAMRDASRAVLGGFEIQTESLIIRYPERFPDESASGLWRVVSELLGRPA